MLPVPTPRLAALTAGVSLLALAAPQPWPALVVLDGALLLCAVIDWVRAPRVDQVGVQRVAPDVLTVGATDTVAWIVRNPTPRRLRVALADELVESLGAPGRRAALVVPARGRARRGVELRPRRRGRFVLQRVTLRVTGPWGLAARQGSRRLRHVLTVYPPFRSRDETELRLRRAQQLRLGERSVRIRGAGMEFDALREYTVDDELRRIDWPATARSPRAIVRTYRAERNQTVLLLVDCGRTMAALVGSRPTASLPEAGAAGAIPRLEHAIDAAQTMTRLATGMGDRVGMVAFADRVLATLPPRSQADQLRRLTLQLSAVDARLAESDYRGAFAHTLGQFPRRALLVVLSELAGEAATQTLLPALPLLRRRHLVVVGAVRDPVVERWSGEGIDTVEQAYRRGAAIRTMQQRSMVAAQLRAAGATVVDAAPGRLAAALSEAYLDTKAAGRL